MKRNLLSPLTTCLALGLFLATTGCEKDKTDYGSVRIVNDSSYTIGYLFISPTSSSDWGTDQLGTYVIEPGDSFTVTHIEVGYYDIRTEDLDHNELASSYNEYVDSAGLTWTLSD